MYGSMRVPEQEDAQMGWGEIYEDYSGLSIVPTGSIFRLGDEGSVVSRPSLTLECVELRNFLSVHMTSLVRTGADAFRLVLNNTTVNRVYFDKGLIYHSGIAGAVNTSEIIIQNMTFNNYNIWNLDWQSLTRKEGYLLSAEGALSASVEVRHSSFSNMSSSLRNTCWAQTSTAYSLPMDNLLKTNPGSRSDLWRYYHASKQDGNNPYSLYYFQLYSPL